MTIPPGARDGYVITNGVRLYYVEQGTGPVMTQVLVRAPGGTGLTTNELLSFTKAVSVVGDGS